MRDLVPQSLFRMPTFRNLWDDEDDLMSLSNIPSGLAISEDDKNVYIEAAVPGVEPSDIDVTFDKGNLWIKAEKKVEEKDGKKYYRNSWSNYSYRIAVPGEIDQNAEYQASCKNGIVKITFAKSPTTQPKKIAVKSE